MFESMQIPIIADDSGTWACNPNGNVQVKELAVTQGTGNDTVVFTNVPKGEYYGYQMFFDTAYSATANTEPPKQIGYPTFTVGSNGLYTVTYTITKVTAAQAGAICLLRIYK